MRRDALFFSALLLLVASNLPSQLFYYNALFTQDFIDLQSSFPESRIPASLVIFKWKQFGTFDHSVAAL